MEERLTEIVDRVCALDRVEQLGVLKEIMDRSDPPVRVGAVLHSIRQMEVEELDEVQSTTYYRVKELQKEAEAPAESWDDNKVFAYKDPK
jgi:hypothetical protein